MCQFCCNKGKLWPQHFGSSVEFWLLNGHSGCLNVCILVCCDAGCVDDENGLRYYVRSRESGKHHKPHIHVERTDHNGNASIAIMDGEVLAGNLKAKDIKKAKSNIENKKQYFLKCWERFTDGVITDINYGLANIDY